MEEIIRPLDLLDSLKGTLVEIKVKDSKDLIKAQLIAFDIHINLVIMRDGQKEFIRGESVFSVREKRA